jgi:hypothetical protein
MSTSCPHILAFVISFMTLLDNGVRRWVVGICVRAYWVSSITVDMRANWFACLSEPGRMHRGLEGFRIDA